MSLSVEQHIFQALRTLVSNRVYRDIAPQTVSTLSRITFQQVGGEAINFLEPTKPSKKNARFQINCWGTRRDDVTALARLVEDALRIYTALQVTVLDAAVSIYEEGAAPDGSAVFGTMQDFSVWYDD